MFSLQGLFGRDADTLEELAPLYRFLGNLSEINFIPAISSLCQTFGVFPANVCKGVPGGALLNLVCLLSLTAGCDADRELVAPDSTCAVGTTKDVLVAILSRSRGLRGLLDCDGMRGEVWLISSKDRLSHSFSIAMACLLMF